MANPTFKEVRAYIAFNLIPKRFCPSGTSWLATSKFRKFAAHFELEDDGALHLLSDGFKLQILEDQSEKYSAIKAAHGLQHSSFKDTFSNIEKQYFWHGMIEDIETWLSSCVDCVEKKMRLEKNVQSIMMDHAYTFKRTAASANEKPVTNKLPRVPVPSLPSPKTYSSKRATVVFPKATSSNVENLSTTKPIHIQEFKAASNIDLSTWDHDYVSDKLTLQRKLHSFVHEEKKDADEDHSSTPSSEPLEISDRHIAKIALKDTLWKPVEFSVNYHLDFMAIPDDAPFNCLYGLEQVVNILKWNQITQMNYLNENDFPSPPVLPCAICDQCGTDFSPSWHKNNADKIVCTGCHKKIASDNNEMESRRNFIDYHNRYNRIFSRVKQDSHKYAEKRAEVKKSMQKKREEALSHFAQMRKVAMLKASIVTKTLLRQKGVKSLNIPPQELFTEKIRRMKAHSKQTSQPRSVVQALERKDVLQKYLESRLAQQKREMKERHFRQLDRHNFLSRAAMGANLLLKREAQRLQGRGNNQHFAMDMQARQEKVQEMRRMLNRPTPGYSFTPKTPFDSGFKMRVPGKSVEDDGEKRMSKTMVNLRALSKQKV